MIEREKNLGFIILPDIANDLTKEDEKEIESIYEKISAGTRERISDVGDIENNPVNSIKQCNDFA
jgi:hypothetical protein